jgi:hypothetical protein
MELSSIELRVFVSLTVILGAGLIALIVDYLKGSNEQLRERNIELSVRREEEGRRSISEIRLLRERMLAAAGFAQAVTPLRETEQTPAAAAAALEPEPEMSTQAIIERAVERAVRQVSAEEAVEPAAEAAGPERAPNSLLDHIIFASMPGQSAPAAAASAPQMERIVLTAAPAAPAQAVEMAKVVLVTPLEEPRVPERATAVRSEPEPAAAGFLKQEIAPRSSGAMGPPAIGGLAPVLAPVSAPAKVVLVTPLEEPRVPERATAVQPEPAAAASAPQVERIVLTVTPATPAQAVEPAKVVLVTPLEEPREPAPAAAGFVKQEMAPKTSGAAGPAAVGGPTPAPAAPERRIGLRSGLGVRREPVRRRGPEIVRPVTELPEGFFGPAEVNALVGDSQSVTGVVVAIGIKDYQRAQQSPSKGGAADLVDSIDRLIRSMVSAGDFAYRRSEDEFIVIFPNETGAAAKQRMNLVAERLWDFQLRSLAAFSALFSWGAVTVVDRGFGDAVELAADEMSETRVSRRGLEMDNLKARRRAANS